MGVEPLPLPLDSHKGAWLVTRYLVKELRQSSGTWSS